MDFGQRALRQQADLNGAYQFLFVARGDFARGICIEAPQDAMQMTRRMILDAGAQSCAQLIRPLRNIRQSFQQSAQVKPTTNRKDRNTAAPAQVIEDRDGHLPISSSGGVFARRQNVDQVMRNSPAFGAGRFHGTDVETFVELGRIASYNFPAESLRKPRT
jgi:hypothetical protein